MWLKKIRLLPLLLSIFSSNSLTDEYFLYKVKPGEIIGNIIERENNSIEEFLLYNPDLDFNSLDGKEIILRSKKNTDLCPRGGEIQSPITYYQSQEQFLVSCLQNIARSIDVKIFEEKNINKFDWKKFEINSDYQNYILYKLKLDLSDSLQKINNENFEDQAFLNWQYYEIFFEAIKRGYPDIQNFYLEAWGLYSEKSASLDESHDRVYKFFRDQISAEEFLSTTAFLDILNLPSYLKMTLLDHLSRETSYFDSAKSDYFNNLVTESIISGLKTGKKYLSLDEFSLVYNAGVNGKKLREYFCNGCSIEDIQQILPKNTQTFKNWVTEFVHLWEINEMWDNYDAFSESYAKEDIDQNYLNFFESQIQSLKKLTQKLEDAYFPPLNDLVAPDKAGDYREWPIASSQYVASNYITFLSKCDVAEKEMARSMRFHRTLDFLDWSWHGNDSLLIAPLILLDCYMRIESHNEEKIEKYFKYFHESAIFFNEEKNKMCNENLEDFICKERIRKRHFEQYEITSDIAETYAYYKQNDLTKARENLLIAYEKTINSNHWLNLESFKRNINYIFYLEKILNTNQIDYLAIKNLIDKSDVADDLMKIRVSEKNKELKEQQSYLLKISKEISAIENLENLTSAKYQELLKKYEEKKIIVSKMFKNSQNLSRLVNEQNLNTSKLQLNLSDKEYLLTYFFLGLNTWAVVVSNSDINLIQLEPTVYDAGFKIDKLRQSLNSKFDLKTSNELYELLFKKVESFLKTGSSIYLYKTTDIRVPFNILTKSFENAQNYEVNLLKSDWLIKHYAFAKYFPVDIEQKSNYNYQDPYLGMANTNTYEFFNLPNLSETANEIINLGISSNAKFENIFIGNKATKEKLVEEIENGYEKIVIATHTVPPGWQWQINEPALLLHSDKNDNYLTASEISQFDLQTDMVVLSSCNEDTIGAPKLFKSFLIAGAKSVVHANWKLESKFSNEFTDEFFKELWINKNLKKHEAMRAVALGFINDYSNEKYIDPAFWGNFSIAYSTL